MGIHGLTKLLSDEAPDCMKEVDLDSLTGRKVAVDASMAMYQFLVSEFDTCLLQDSYQSAYSCKRPGLVSSCSEVPAYRVRLISAHDRIAYPASWRFDDHKTKVVRVIGRQHIGRGASSP